MRFLSFLVCLLFLSIPLISCAEDDHGHEAVHVESDLAGDFAAPEILYDASNPNAATDYSAVPAMEMFLHSVSAFQITPANCMNASFTAASYFSASPLQIAVDGQETPFDASDDEISVTLVDGSADFCVDDPNASPWQILDLNIIQRRCTRNSTRFSLTLSAVYEKDGEAMEHVGVRSVIMDLDQGYSCGFVHLAPPEAESHDEGLTWRSAVSAMGAMALSSTASLIGIGALFLTHIYQRFQLKEFLPELLSVASGTFIGSVVFILLPETGEVLGMSSSVTAVILGGILFGMVSETLIHHFLAPWLAKRFGMDSAGSEGHFCAHHGGHAHGIAEPEVEMNQQKPKALKHVDPESEEAQVVQVHVSSPQSKAEPEHTLLKTADAVVAEADTDSCAPTKERDGSNSSLTSAKASEASHAEPEGKTHSLNFVVLNCVADGIHNFIDGALIGATFLVSQRVGWTATAAIIVHELPQELSDFGLMIDAGISPSIALCLNFLISLTGFLGAIIALFVGDSFSAATTKVMPFAAGIFIYLGISLIPNLLAQHGKRLVRCWAAFACGLGIMALLLLFPHSHEESGGHAGHGH